MLLTPITLGNHKQATERTVMLFRILEQQQFKRLYNDNWVTIHLNTLKCDILTRMP